MSVDTPAFRMADRLLEGRLSPLIATYRAAGRSWDQISRDLFIEGGVEVTPETLRMWARKLGIETERESA